MAHFGTLRDYKFAQEAGDIRGAELYGAKDEKLGKIDDVIFDHTSGSQPSSIPAAGCTARNSWFPRTRSSRDPITTMTSP